VQQREEVGVPARQAGSETGKAGKTWKKHVENEGLNMFEIALC